MEASPRRLVIQTLLLYSALVFLFTGLSLAFGGAANGTGGVRPIDTIPAHLAELAGFGLLLGVGTLVFYGRKGLWLLLLTPSLVLLLDLDHLPIYLGIPQPIRPAHSLVFLAAAVLLTAAIVRKLEIELILVSSFTAHLGVDTGVFPPLSPLNFDYLQLEPYRLPLLLVSVVLALAAGLMVRRRNR